MLTNVETSFQVLSLDIYIISFLNIIISYLSILCKILIIFLVTQYFVY